MAGCYPKEAAAFSRELIALLDKHADVLEPALLQTLTRALILLRNRGQVTARCLPAGPTPIGCEISDRGMKASQIVCCSARQA